MNDSVRKFYQYFKDIDTIKDQPLQFRRAYALADIPVSVSNALPQTVHAPSNVTPTSIPASAPPPPAQYGEHTDNAEPPETTNDGDVEDTTDAVRAEAALDMGFTKDSALNAADLESILEFTDATFNANTRKPDEVRKAFNTQADLNANLKIVPRLEPGA
eukprot:2002368-Pleurochrysis_carterae.AAC.1